MGGTTRIRSLRDHFKKLTQLKKVKLYIFSFGETSTIEKVLQQTMLLPFFTKIFGGDRHPTNDDSLHEWGTYNKAASIDEYFGAMTLGKVIFVDDDGDNIKEAKQIPRIVLTIQPDGNEGMTEDDMKKIEDGVDGIGISEGASRWIL